MPEWYETTGTEQEFLDRYQQEEDKWEKPSVTVDCVMFRYHENKPQILLIKRKAHPFKDVYALPGGFVNKDEDLVDATIREVQEETSVYLKPHHIEQLVTVGTPHRDPRRWVITVAHLCYLPFDTTEVAVAGDDAQTAEWFDIEYYHGRTPELLLKNGDHRLYNLAFDHWSIVKTACDRIRGRLDYDPTILRIMPVANTMSDYRLLYAAFEDRCIDMPQTTFNRKYQKFFKATSQIRTGPHRPAKLFRYKLKNDL